MKHRLRSHSLRAECEIGKSTWKLSSSFLFEGALRVALIKSLLEVLGNSVSDGNNAKAYFITSLMGFPFLNEVEGRRCKWTKSRKMCFEQKQRSSWQVVLNLYGFFHFIVE